MPGVGCTGPTSPRPCPRPPLPPRPPLAAGGPSPASSEENRRPNKATDSGEEGLESGCRKESDGGSGGADACCGEGGDGRVEGGGGDGRSIPVLRLSWPPRAHISTTSTSELRKREDVVFAAHSKAMPKVINNGLRAPTKTTPSSTRKKCKLDVTPRRAGSHPEMRRSKALTARPVLVRPALARPVLVRPALARPVLLLSAAPEKRGQTCPGRRQRILRCPDGLKPLNLAWLLVAQLRESARESRHEQAGRQSRCFPRSPFRRYAFAQARTRPGQAKSLREQRPRARRLLQPPARRSCSKSGSASCREALVVFCCIHSRIRHHASCQDHGQAATARGRGSVAHRARRTRRQVQGG
eukprot:2613740-Prymnesium_polylepis.2